MSFVIVLNCPDCGVELQTGLEAAGKRKPCPECGNKVVVPKSHGVQPSKPTATPERLAELTALTQDVAEEQRAKKCVLEQIRPLELQKCLDELASEVNEGETPLMLWGDVLVTDAALYSSVFERMPLEDIRYVSKRRFHIAQWASLGPKHRLYVNGFELISASFAEKPLRTLLERIAERNLANPETNAIDAEEELFISAAAALNGCKSEEIAQLLTNNGIDQVRALALADCAYEVANRSRRFLGLQIVLGGVFLIVICNVLAALMSEMPPRLVIMLFKSVSGLGLALIVGGLYILITGRARLEPNDVVETMEREEQVFRE